MARGWDSKAVEDQIGAAEAEKETRARPALTPEQREQQLRLDGLELSRSRLLASLEAARDPRHRALIERALAHVESEIRAIHSGSDEGPGQGTT